MIFRKDYLKQLTGEQLDQMITDSDLNREEMLTDAEATALSIIENYLSIHYDTSRLLTGSKGQTRTKLKEWAVSITVYVLNERWRKNENIPSAIVQAYESTLLTLKAIAAGDQTIDAPKRMADKDTSIWPEDDFNSDFDLNSAFDFDF